MKHSPDLLCELVAGLEDPDAYIGTFASKKFKTAFKRMWAKERDNWV
jgi:hypothetical protein